MSDVAHWSVIDSDPGVFTELIGELGCEGAQMEEIWSLENESFKNLEPVHGLIFLFKWLHSDEPDGAVLFDCNHIFFAKQVNGNACGTLAILSLLMNLEHEDIKLGAMLTNFKNFCRGFGAYSKGILLSNEAQIKKVHNSFGRQTLNNLDLKQIEQEESAYHFVSYMPINGRVYELDGLKEGPIDLGEVKSGRSWSDVVRPFIERRMQRYNKAEIHFNLMALISDRQRNYEKQIENLLHPAPTAVKSEADRQAAIHTLRTHIAFEVDKKKRYKVENMRRKHNYLPFIMELLKMLGEKGQLLPIYEKAKQNALEQEKLDPESD